MVRLYLASFVLSIACSLLPVVGASAQVWILDVGLGRTTHELAVTEPEGVGASVGVRHQGPHWFYVLGHIPTAGGVPWAASGAGTRLVSVGRSFAYGVDVGAHAHGYRDRTTDLSGGGAMLEALPLVGLSGDYLRVEARSGLQHYASRFDGESISRRVHTSDARLVIGSARLRATAEGRYLRADEANYPYAGVAIGAVLSDFSLWAYSGRWFSDRVDDSPVWGMGGQLALGSTTGLYAAFHREATNPLYLNAPRTSWSAGLTRRIGPSLIPRSPASVAPMVENDQVTFRLPLALASEPPALAGDFTGWTAVPMVRAGEFWTVALSIPSGVYSYAFRRADGVWFVPNGLPTREDGMGGVSAILILP